ncbi:MAG: AmmeMemoRadiSam system protein B [Desulfamplus sp.]|nr:AmmeMemoRadiSam system protein B [Desulfamplus sp.]
MEIKRAAFAGSWYPSNGSECKEQIEQFLTQKNGAIKNGNFVGGIVPHAGWFFSGSIACRVIASIANSSSAFDTTIQKTKSKKVDAVFIFGMHMNPLAKPCIMVNGAWQTPFGDLAVHEPLASEFINNFNLLNPTINLKIDSAHSFPEENTIELQLPFIKYFFAESHIVPIGVPPSDVAQTIGILAVESAQKLGLNVVFIGSTDMTHYGNNYGFAPTGSGQKALDWVKAENDPKAINAMCNMDCHEIVFQGLKNRNLCCAGAVAAAAAASKKMGATKGISFDYATSYEKNPGSSFVGYSGILFAL